MRKSNLLLAGIVISSMFSMPVFAQSGVIKGQTWYVRYLSRHCRADGVKGGFALSTKHTRAEWGKFKANGNFVDELIRICPTSARNDKSIHRKLKKKEEYIYQFLWEYASDGNK